MSGPLNVSKLVCYQGVDFLETRLFFTPPANGSTDVQNLVPFDFTGCAARMAIRMSPDPSATLLQSLTSSGAGLSFVSATFVPGPPQPGYNDGIQIVITKAQSLAMNGGVPVLGAYYDLLVDLPNGTTLLLMSGVFDLAPTVTR